MADPAPVAQTFFMDPCTPSISVCANFSPIAVLCALNLGCDRSVYLNLCAAAPIVCV